MPAAGPHLPLRAGLDPDGVPEANVRQADSDLPADRARPRALHPLLPLHPLLRAGRRGRAARRARARRQLVHRHVRGRAVPRPLLRQRRRAVSGGRPHLDGLPLPRRARGRSRTSPRSAASARWAATPGRRRARARSRACCRATIRRSTAAGSATRAASPTTICGPPIACERRSSGCRAAASIRGRLGSRRSTPPSSGLRAAAGSVAVAFSVGETLEQADAIARLVRQGLGSDCGDPAGRPRPGARRLPRPALGDRTARALRRPRRRPRRRAGARSSISGSGRLAAPARTIVTVHRAARSPSRPARPPACAPSCAGDSPHRGAAASSHRRLRERRTRRARLVGGRPHRRPPPRRARRPARPSERDAIAPPTTSRAPRTAEVSRLAWHAGRRRAAARDPGRRDRRADRLRRRGARRSPRRSSSPTARASCSRRRCS